MRRGGTVGGQLLLGMPRLRLVGGQRRAGMQRRAGVQRPATALLLAAVLVACSSPTSPSPLPATPTPIATATPSVGPSSDPAPTPSVALDPTLLAVLPASVAGFEVTESPDAETAALADPQLAAVGSRMAAGIAVDPVSGEFVYAVVVRLKAGTMNDAVFRDWRDSYDEGACSQAGGVSGNAQTEISGNTVYIGTCAGGVRTYHVWLEASGLLVSASSVGDHRFGEMLMNDLRLP